MEEMVRQLLIAQLREIAEEVRKLRDANVPEPVHGQHEGQGGADDSRPAGR
jgi:hypothetical protein